MNIVAALVAALLGFLALVFGYGKVQQKRGRAAEQARFNQLVAEQENVNAQRAESVAAAPRRSPDELAALVRHLASASRRRKAKLSGSLERGE